MKRLVSIISLLTVAHCIFAQNWAQVQRDGDKYVWGEGWGQTLEEADNQALAMLSSKISLIVSNEFHSTEGQSSTGTQTSHYVSIENNLHTFSTASLTNTGVEILESGRKSHVVRWIARSDIEKIRNTRYQRVLEYVSEAERNEMKGNVGNALKGYFWAYALACAYSDLSGMSYRDEEGVNHTLSHWLPEKINGILSDIHVTATITGNHASLSFSFRGKPAEGIDFSYFDGRGWNDHVSAINGRKSIELAYNVQPEYLHIRYEYMFLSQARLDRELEAALSAIKDEPLRKAWASIKIK